MTEGVGLLRIKPCRCLHGNGHGIQVYDIASFDYPGMKDKIEIPGGYKESRPD